MHGRTIHFVLTVALAIACFGTVSQSASGHTYNCNIRHNSLCTMQQHDDAHRRGLEHDSRGNWFRPATQQQAMTIAVQETAPTEGFTPEWLVKWTIAKIGLTADDTFCDIGCGDGRWLIEASKCGCMSVGFEISPVLADEARANVRKAGLSHRIVIITGDAMESQLLGGCSVAVMYLTPDMVKQVVPLLINARTIVSVAHELPQPLFPQTRHKVNDWQVYVWEK